MDYQVEGVDYTILELDVSGNSSRYSFKKDVWPRFEYKIRRNGKLNKAILFCTPFAIPQKGFCVTKKSFSNACSCEHLGKDTFRLRANFTIKTKEMSHGKILLTWPGKRGPVRYDYDLPEVRAKPAEPEIKVIQIEPFFNCAADYQVVGEDYTILELDVSGNSSSCEHVGNDTFRLRANFTIRIKEISHGQISLTWPGKFGPVRYDYDLPEVKLKETQPKIYVFRKSSYFTCTEDYQVLGVDYTLLELDVSKNHSLHSYEKDRGPRFEYKTRSNGKLNMAIPFCTPFTDRQNGFCVTKQSFPNGCSCEQVGVDRYRLKANFTVTTLEMSHGMLSLTWPGKRGELRYDYNLPGVKSKPKRDEKPEGKTRGLRIVHILGLVQGAGLLTTGGYLYFCE
ncbi:hypothetical protein PoB_003535700 [Plakobranchus ocellatus]|uniref:Uncharacterized protein n=1 Tax=Plakobranchus ocellatus TaxID=259542 RepID=A0AAV4APJ5_9GAST|nr:hypothetical protein PoB_003535700 [Plakobranchus ocellatus]